MSDSTVALSYLFYLRDDVRPAIISEGSYSPGRLAAFLPSAGKICVTATARNIHRPTPQVEGDPWMDEVARAIADYRGLKDGWDGPSSVAPSEELLDSAEIVAQAFVHAPVINRPIFSVDAGGRPTFSSYQDNGFYLHLTVDEPDAISWYAIKNGNEEFEDEIALGDISGEDLAAKVLGA